MKYHLSKDRTIGLWSVDSNVFKGTFGTNNMIQMRHSDGAATMTSFCPGVVLKYIYIPSLVVNRASCKNKKILSAFTNWNGGK